MISDSDEEQQSDPGVEANDEEDSTDELDLIGDGHESELLADSLALQGAEELAASTCNAYEYLSYAEACAYAFQHSNHLQQAMAASGGTHLSPEPKDWRDIKGRPDADKWLQAAHEEIMGLLENGTFTLERVPDGRTPIGCR